MRNKVLFPDLTQNKLLWILGFTILMLLTHVNLQLLIIVHELGHEVGFIAGIGLPLGITLSEVSGHAYGFCFIYPFASAGAFSFPFAVAIILPLKFRGYAILGSIAGVATGIAMLQDYARYSPNEGDFAQLTLAGGIAPWVILTTIAMVAEFFFLQWYVKKLGAKIRAIRRARKIGIGKVRSMASQRVFGAKHDQD